MNPTQASRKAFRQLRDAHPEEFRALYIEAMGYPERSCRICGGPYWSGNAKHMTCGPECNNYWKVLRYVVDEHHRARQLQATAAWRMSSLGETSEYLKRVASGEQIRGDQARGRWLIEGTDTFDKACECVVNGWPIADEFPDQIFLQIVAALKAVS